MIFYFANQVFSHEFFRLVWLKDRNNIPRLLFYPFQDNQQTNAFSIPKHWCHDLSCWWNRPCLLWCWTTGFCPLFQLLFGFWCVMVNPSLIHSNKSTHKISFILLKRSKHCSESAAPILRKSFFISNSSCKIYPTRFFEMPIVSAISRTFIRQSSNTTSCTCSVLSGIVALFGHPSRGSSSWLVWPRLNSTAHSLIVKNEREESP